MNILLGISGGIAAYKGAMLASLFKKQSFEVNVVMTHAATKFIAPLTFETLTNNPVAVDTFDIKRAWEVEHISLAKKSDIAVLAPATANVIAKLALGLADDMLTTVFLALTCPVYIAPAMNTAMLNNPATQSNIAILKSRGFTILEPDEGLLACGDSGAGRMMEPEEICGRILALPKAELPLAGKKVLITAGPTREAIDPVRFISNRSSGKMGYALATAACEAGADVCIVSGPVQGVTVHDDAEIIQVESAAQMHAAVMKNKDACDIIIACAAVADYTPEETFDHKLKKKEELVLRMIKTKDILESLGKNKDFYLAGFAAETHDMENYAKEKLVRKNLDMIIANDVSRSDTGFESDHNEITIFKRNGQEIRLAKATKANIAREIIKEIAADIN